MAVLRLPLESRNAMLDALTSRIDAARKPGRIDLYAGSEPESADDSSRGKMLASLSLAKPAFGRARLGAADAHAIRTGSASDTGKAGWARITDGDGKTVLDCDVGRGGCVINLNTTDINAGGPVIIDSFQLRMPGG